MPFLRTSWEPSAVSHQRSAVRLGRELSTQDSTLSTSPSSLHPLLSTQDLGLSTSPSWNRPRRNPDVVSGSKPESKPAAPHYPSRTQPFPSNSAPSTHPSALSNAPSAPTRNTRIRSAHSGPRAQPFPSNSAPRTQHSALLFPLRVRDFSRGKGYSSAPIALWNPSLFSCSLIW